MATKSAKTAQTNRAKEVKEVKVPIAIGINKLNKKAIKVSDRLVDETLATGEEWQAILAKAVKNSTILLDKQNDIMFDTLEEVKAYVLKGNSRFRKLFAIDYAEAKLAKYGKMASKKMTATATPIAIGAKARVEKLADKLEDLAEDTLDNAKAMIDVIPTIDEAKKVAKKTTKKVAAKSTSKKVAAKSTSKKATVKASAKKAVKVTPKATVTKVAKKVVAKTTSAKSDLKVIEGVGPKIESLLNAAGILTFDQLAKANAADVKEILLAAGSRYKMHNPATWMEQATLAAAGKTVELKALQAELKGGKK